jgi:predicted porin
MQKKLIALAVASLVSGAAFAQVAPNNITLGGIIDVGYMYSSKGQVPTLKSHSSIDSGYLDGSRFTLTGSEDLGNGLKVGFSTEFDFGTDFTSGGLSVAKNNLNIGGGWGTVSAGSFGSALDDINGYGETGNGWGNGVIGMISTTDSMYNAVKYNSPDFNGISFMAGYATNIGNTQDSSVGTQQPGYSARVSYVAGPVKFGLGALHRKNDVLVGTAPHANEWLTSGSYDFGVVKLGGTYSHAKLENNNVNKNWRINLGAPIGANDAVSVSYSRTRVTNTGYSAHENGVGLSYQHTLSKRTFVYANYGQSSGDDIASVTGGFDRAFRVGLHHNF